MAFDLGGTTEDGLGERFALRFAKRDRRVLTGSEERAAFRCPCVGLLLIMPSSTRRFANGLPELVRSAHGHDHAELFAQLLERR